MLRELSIRNLAVVEEVNVTFHHGFHVLTGETGAGKSIIIDALSLVVGGRGSADMVRYGCERAEMEAMFDLPATHPVWKQLDRLGVQYSTEEMLVIKRELSSHGKSSSRVNGQLVTISMLKEIGECLVNIHGQHEHQSLLRTEQHLEWLDMFGGDLLLERKQQYKNAYDQLQQARSSLRELEDSTRHNVQMLDLYRFQIEEISNAALKPLEDEQLMEQRRLLTYAEKRIDAVSEAYTLMSGGKGLDVFSKAISKLNDIQNYDPEVLGPLLEQLQSAFYQAEDAVFQLRDYRDGIETNPEELSYVEDRLDLINGLKRKYGETIPDILAYLEKTTSERDKIENRDELLEGLRKLEEERFMYVAELAKELSQLRLHASTRLSQSIEQELKQLQMPAARFQVQLDRPLEDDLASIRKVLNANGFDAATFMLSTNPGEPLKPLNKIASGGEMSRIMLALKSIFAEIDQIPVLIFDEVDTGVSGRAAQAIAEKLSRLAAKCQVFSITHLPQVACMSDHHYEIRKQVIGERTSTSVNQLINEARIDELARMLGGVEITEKTRHHAQEMLDLAHGLKGA
ncbi:DNA repair protein RecN [Paenibacillus sp. GSMTC-2017]|uniref:DNA repair protein RecN n=1 Tax=Paenibacillus sp. GSMTC-2017 TaxID=2794350 RepID=UPI0018D747C3|nr:DNA repair protein RecN [Paenibacillus sp. GSMTC-2017]MBH5318052.1 DNA repair protein RecN [Paenibacillus sp. GSMTC-2017]